MHGGGQFWASDLVAGVFTDHLHNEGGDGVRQHVLDLQNLLVVFLSHCSHLCEAGYHFGIQQAEITAWIRWVSMRIGLTVSGLKVAFHSLFLWAFVLAVNPGFQCHCQLFVNFINGSVLLHSWTIW